MKTRVSLKYFVSYCRFKRNFEVKFKGNICAELRLKFWFESDWNFCNITELEWF